MEINGCYIGRVSVVTGANRGIGFATVRGLCKDFEGKVVLTARDELRGRKAMRRLFRVGCHPDFMQLDVSDRRSVDAFAAKAKDKYGGLDVVVNNAGVRYRHDAPLYERVNKTFATNFYGTLYFMQTIFPLILPHGRIVFLVNSCGFLSQIPSSRLRSRLLMEDLTATCLRSIMGEFQTAVRDNDVAAMREWGDDPYCIANVGLLVLSRIIHRYFVVDDNGQDIIVNCYYPGNVSTMFNSYSGTIQPSEAAENVVRLANLPEFTECPSGDYVWPNFSVVDWTGQKPGH